MMYKKLLISLLAASLLAVGCDSDNDSNNETPSTNPGGGEQSGGEQSGGEQSGGSAQTVVKRVDMTEKALTSADLVEVSDEDALAWAESLNAFGYDFQGTMEHDKSFVFSPFSFHTALSMTAHGAKGVTHDEMVSALHLTGDYDKDASLNGAMRNILRYDGQGEGAKFEIANRIWIDDEMEVVPSFEEAMNNYYKAPLQIVDMQADTKALVDTVNLWVSNITDSMIKDLLQYQDVPQSARFIIVNAIHFVADWKYKFEYENTRDAKFTKLDSSKVDVKMMYQLNMNLAYDETEDYKAVIMPYAGGKFDMIFVVPTADDGINKVLSAQDGSFIHNIMNSAKDAAVSLSIPKFKIETRLGEAVDSFKALGMKAAFESGADFSGMISNDPELLIGKIVHKAVIEVDEEGTKAAAATAVIGKDGGAYIEDLKSVCADHPFAYALVHHDSQAVLFAGAYMGD